MHAATTLLEVRVEVSLVDLILLLASTAPSIEFAVSDALLDIAESMLIHL